MIPTMTHCGVPATISQGDRGAVRSGAAAGARDGRAEHGVDRADGTKIHANASRHSALSYEQPGKIEAQLKAEVADLMAKAEAADAADIPDGMSIPDELARREERLRKIAEARTKIEVRAKERHAREMAEMKPNSRRATPRLRPRARSLAASRRSSTRAPLPSDQINLADEDSRVMPVAEAGLRTV